MKITKIPEHWRTTSIGVSFECKAQKASKNAVLLIHGYTGTSFPYRYLAENIANAGFFAKCPRLPGHGTWHEDFQSTTARDWLRRVIDSYLDLQEEYETVDIVGHSMGGVLACILAGLFPDKIKKLILLAPSLSVYKKSIFLTPFLQFFISRLKDYSSNDIPETPDLEPEEEGEDPEEVAWITKEYWDYTYPKMAYQLLKLMRLGKKMLGKITADTLVIVSDNDKSVPPSVQDLVLKKIRSEKKYSVNLHESNHMLISDKEKERVCEEVLRWLAGGVL